MEKGVRGGDGGGSSDEGGIRGNGKEVRPRGGLCRRCGGRTTRGIKRERSEKEKERSGDRG